MLAKLLFKRLLRDPLSWSFWICAFANNQFALDHATGDGQDVHTSSFATALRCKSCKGVAAVLDEDGEIYRRIWCAFEIFYVTRVLPGHMNGRHLEVELVNGHGIVSSGDGTKEDINRMHDIIQNVCIADARASVEADIFYIRNAMHSWGTSNEDLDDFLSGMARDAIRAVRLRRWGPLLIFSCTPGLAIDLSMALFNGVHYICTTLQNNLPWTINDVYVRTSGFFFGTALFWSFLLCCGTCTCCFTSEEHSSFASRLRKRMLGIMLFYLLPVVSLCTWCAVETLLHPPFNEQAKDLHALPHPPHCRGAYSAMGLIVTANQIFMLLGFIIGIVHAILRNWRCCSKQRRLLEVMLFD